MKNRALLVVIFFAGAAASACTQRTASPIVAAPLGSDIGDDDSDDPYACAVVETHDGTYNGNVVPVFVQGWWAFDAGTLGYAGVCKQTGTGCWLTGNVDPSCTAGAPGCGGFSASGGTLSGGQHMVCEHLCNVTADCPQPETGAAVVVCSELHTCMLTCANGEACPDGFRCIQPGLGISQPDGTAILVSKQCVQYKSISLPR